MIIKDVQISSPCPILKMPVQGSFGISESRDFSTSSNIKYWIMRVNFLGHTETIIAHMEMFPDNHDPE